MKIHTILLVITLLLISNLNAQALFEVKDASDQTVLEVSADGLRIFNEGDTLMVISSTEIKAFIANSKDKALSRSFSVTTSTTGKGTGDVVNIDTDGMRVYNDNDKLMDITASNITAYIDSSSEKALSRSFSVTTSTTGKESFDILDITTEATKMREGTQGNRYSDFSPENIFMGLNAGINTEPYDHGGYDNVFLGNDAGVANQWGRGNVFIGMNAGKENVMGGTSVMIGAYAGQTTSQSEENTFIGFNAGGSSGGGDQNVYLGASAGGTFGWMNVMLGNHSGSSNSGDGNIFIGYASGADETGSNKLYIANSNTTTPLIKGTFPNVDLDLTATNINLNGTLSTSGNATVGGTLTTTGNANLNGTQTWVNHSTGTNNGFFIKNKSATYPWHFYEYSTGDLKLYYNGLLRGTWNQTTGVYSSSSDKRFKKNIEEFTNVLDKLMLLSPKRYNFISQNDSEQKYIGFIAQDVKELFPAFVQYNEEDDKYTMDYAGLSVVAIQAIKEQQKKIEEQQVAIEENMKLKDEINDLRSEIEEIKKKLK